MALELKKAGETFTVTDAQVVKDGDPETVYTIRPITREDFERIGEKVMRACVRREYNPQTRQVEDVFTMEDRRRATVETARALIDHALVDWVGVVHNGEPLPCTLENKLALPIERQDGIVELAKNYAQRKETVQQETFPAAAEGR